VHQITVVTMCCVAVPEHDSVTILVPKIARWLLEAWKFSEPLFLNIVLARNVLWCS